MVSHPNQSTLWRLDSPLLLASASAARRLMLVNAGLPVETCPSYIDERAFGDDETEGLPPLASRLAHAKAVQVSKAAPSRLVLGADQTLVCDGTAFHKPGDTTTLGQQLQSLQGRTHHLLSAYCLARGGIAMAEGTGLATMTMRPLSSSMIGLYLEALGDAPPMTVGGYQIEGLGAQLFSQIDGEHFTILGLPLMAVLASLRHLGALAE